MNRPVAAVLLGVLALTGALALVADAGTRQSPAQHGQRVEGPCYGIRVIRAA